ncbi:MAG: hypothetical protein F6K42_05795 [Leptolyngbya sp. SIO1D8]|nr:hypothetical protein [Leptolyngbya sp. SIO1D8]
MLTEVHPIATLTPFPVGVCRTEAGALENEIWYVDREKDILRQAQVDVEVDEIDWHRFSQDKVYAIAVSTHQQTLIRIARNLGRVDELKRNRSWTTALDF